MVSFFTCHMYDSYKTEYTAGFWLAYKQAWGTFRRMKRAKIKATIWIQCATWYLPTVLRKHLFGCWPQNVMLQVVWTCIWDLGRVFRSLSSGILLHALAVESFHASCQGGWTGPQEWDICDNCIFPYWWIQGYNSGASLELIQHLCHWGKVRGHVFNIQPNAPAYKCCLYFHMKRQENGAHPRCSSCGLIYCEDLIRV